MIIMVYAHGYDKYLPVFYILLQSKHQLTYYLALQEAFVASEFTMDASTISCDFEKGLIQAIQWQFPKSVIIGCVFQEQIIRLKDIINTSNRFLIKAIHLWLNLSTFLGRNQMPKSSH
jgi:hypothetical protein